MSRWASAGVVAAALVALAGCMGGEGEVQRPDQPVPCPRSPDGAPLAGAFDARELLGLEEARASEAASRRGCRLRVVERDGERGPITQDLRADRVNVVIEGGTVVALDGVY